MRLCCGSGGGTLSTQDSVWLAKCVCVALSNCTVVVVNGGASLSVCDILTVVGDAHMCTAVHVHRCLW